MKPTILLIINPKAGTQRKTDIQALLQRVFRECTHPFDALEMVLTTHAGHATEVAQNAAKKGVALCISVGGDGTMNETAVGLRHSETVLGILPMGSGNGLARHIGLSMRPEIAFAQLLTGNAVTVDSATANSRPYFLSAGIGFEGVVADGFATRGSRGFGTYISQSINHLIKYKSLDLAWSADGVQDMGKVFTMTFANGAQYGNNAFIAPGASIRDGKLNMALVRKFPLMQSPTLVWRLMRNQLIENRFYSQQAVSHVVVEASIAMQGHVDGEPVDFGKRLEVKIIPASLKIQVPIGKQWF